MMVPTLKIIDRAVKVAVITPSIGKETLRRACETVGTQALDSGVELEHWIVADGREFTPAIQSHIPLNHPYEFIELPKNIGKNGFYGHRIYAGVPHFIDSDYIMFLDEDNWYAPDHVQSLVSLMQKRPIDFGFSLRNIHDQDGKFICEDNCESLGLIPTWVSHKHNRPEYLVDTSSYIFKTDFLVSVSSGWHHGWGADRRFFNVVRQHYMFNSTQLHTLCYRLDGNSNSVKADFFLEGNEYYQHTSFGEIV